MEEHAATSAPALVELEGQRSRRGWTQGRGATVTTREAAAILGITERSVRRAIARGELPAVRRGNAYRIDSDELEHFAARWEQPAWSAESPRVVPFAAPASSVTPPPTPLSPFVGREAELATLSGLLRDPAVRLITLLGPGGIGKTRLAIAAAAAVADRFPDGVAFVALASVTRPEAVVPAIADALSLRATPGRDRRAQVQSFLESKQLLLVLDNLEQLLAVAPEVAQILASAPGITVLSTSRAPLQLSGERAMRVPPMSMAGECATLADILASDAGKLFVARAQEHDPAFAVDEASAPWVAGVCARLDGLPLAIELAAARVNVLSPRQLHDRLERRLPLLTGGGRDAPRRHGTMRDAIAWSYELLSEPERRLFRRLAVFTGGFSLEAAEGVSGVGCRLSETVDTGTLPDTQHPTPNTLDLVASLVGHSLLERERGPDGEPRFRMLETVREFGLEQLRDGEATAARDAHADYALAFAQSLRPLANTQAVSAAHDRLAADDANIQAALQWFADRDESVKLARLTAACRIYWFARSRLQEAATWLGRALAGDAAIPDIDRARLQVGSGELLMLKGDPARAESCFAAALPALRRAGDPFDIAMALISRGAAFNMAGRCADAELCLSEALSLADAIPDPMLRAAVGGGALANLSVSARGQGQLDLAAARCEEALQRYHGLGLDLAETRTLMDLSEIARDQGTHRLAAQRYLTCIEQTGERGDMRVIADALTGIANVAAAWNQPRAALRLFGAAYALRERVGINMTMPLDAELIDRGLGSLQDAVGDRQFTALVAEGRALPLAEAVSIAVEVTTSATRSAVKVASPAVLTRREREVLRLIAESQTDREIAAALYLSPRTVSWHVSTILAKLRVESRREAIAQAHANGWL